MRRPKFSICIPNYNYENFIGDTIQSVLDQDYSDYELLIADNASTDFSIKVIEKFDDARIRLIRNRTNVGFAPNLDKASEMATGDYILMISADDLLKSNALSTYASLIGQYESHDRELVLCSSLDIIDENNIVQPGRQRFALHEQISRLVRPSIDRPSVHTGNDLLQAALSDNFVIIGRFLSLCYSRKLYEELEGYRSIMSICPDTHFSHRLMSLNPTVIVEPKALFSYRVHSDNNYAAIYTHPKVAIDNYQMSQLYTTDFLASTGLKVSDIQRNFVGYWGVKAIFGALVSNRVKYAFRLWHFVWSVYPNYYRLVHMAWIFPLCALFIPTLAKIVKILK